MSALGESLGALTPEEAQEKALERYTVSFRLFIIVCVCVFNILYILLYFIYLTVLYNLFYNRYIVERYNYKISFNIRNIIRYNSRFINIISDMHQRKVFQVSLLYLMKIDASIYIQHIYI